MKDTLSMTAIRWSQMWSVYPDQIVRLALVPNVVSVSGSNRQIAAMEFVETEELVLDNARNSFSKRLALSSNDVYGITFDPDSVTVYVTVGPVRRKVFPGVEVSLINAPLLKKSTISLIGKSVDSVKISEIR